MILKARQCAGFFMSAKHSYTREPISCKLPMIVLAVAAGALQEELAVAEKLLFKRGDTFLISIVVKIGGVPQDITNWTILSQVRDGERLVADLEYTVLDAVNGSYQLRYDDTVTWLGIYNWDIQYTMDTGQIISTRTVTLDCRQDTTR